MINSPKRSSKNKNKNSWSDIKLVSEWEDQAYQSRACSEMGFRNVTDNLFRHQEAHGQVQAVQVCR